MNLIPWTAKSDVPTRHWPDMNRLFEDFFTDRVFQFNGQRSWPVVDILEKDGNLVLHAEVPGLSEKDIDLKLEGNVLTLRGTRTIENEKDRDHYHRVESFHGAFTRSFTLPEGVDREKIKAEYRNGMLIITIPQRPEVRPRQIPVSVK